MKKTMTVVVTNAVTENQVAVVEVQESSSNWVSLAYKKIAERFNVSGAHARLMFNVDIDN